MLYIAAKDMTQLVDFYKNKTYCFTKVFWQVFVKISSRLSLILRHSGQDYFFKEKLETAISSKQRVVESLNLVKIISRLF